MHAAYLHDSGRRTSSTASSAKWSADNQSMSKQCTNCWASRAQRTARPKRCLRAASRPFGLRLYAASCGRGGGGPGGSGTGTPGRAGEMNNKKFCERAPHRPPFHATDPPCTPRAEAHRAAGRAVQGGHRAGHRPPDRAGHRPPDRAGHRAPPKTAVQCCWCTRTHAAYMQHAAPPVSISTDDREALSVALSAACTPV